MKTEGAAPPIVFHYHLFKNAGSSVDDMLRENFADRWEKIEFPAGGRSSADVLAFLNARPDLDAVSSHTAMLPVPALDRRPVFPILFLRHPLDRLRSAYLFERTQKVDTVGTRLARAHDLAGYLVALLEIRGHRQARNFQTHRLAANHPPSAGPELARALRTLSELPFVGLVEEYERSIQRLEAMLKPSLPGFRAVALHRNVTQGASSSLAGRLAAMKAEVGEELFDRVVEANLDDLELYEAARRLFA